MDYDPASAGFDEPVDLNHPWLLAQDGLASSEGSPQYHQQMVYAVAMTTIQNFELALGRSALWASHHGLGKMHTHALGFKATRLFKLALRLCGGFV